MLAPSLKLETDRSLLRGKSRLRHVLASIVAPEGDARQRPPVNLGLVLDRSGSMTGEKIRLCKDAAVAAVRRLDPRDRFSLVAYDDRIDVVVPSTAALPPAVDAAVRAIMGIEARGSTNLCGGWLSGCEQVGLAQRPEAVNRVLLLTDGLANQGIRDPDQIVQHASELRRRGIATTTIGVGEDFDEHLLGRIADEGGGHFYYVERDEQIPAHIETEVGEALEVTLKDASLRVGPAGGLMVAPIASYPTRREGDDWVIELGDLVSLQELAVPVGIAFEPGRLAGPDGAPVLVSFVLAFVVNGTRSTAARAEVGWRIAPAPEVGAQPRNRTVDRAVAEAYASQARREAGRLNREGDFTAARERLQQIADRIRMYAGDDEFLNGLVRDLERDMEAHAHRMTSRDLKSRYMGTYELLKQRGLLGGSKRTGPSRGSGS